MQTAEDPAPLHDLHILVTRPQAQADDWLHAIEAQGATASHFPLITIQPLPLPAVSIDASDLVVFISTNAVEHGHALLERVSHKSRIAAIGSATATRLKQLGYRVDFCPDRQDSEGLLSLPGLQGLDQQTVLIVRGRGGREHLAEQLRARGARVEYAEVYQRAMPADRLDPKLAACDAIVITSGEALENLVQIARRDAQTWVFARQLVLNHSRYAGRVADLGFTLKPVVARQPDIQGVLAALREWAQYCRRSD